jgi:hypothetical protein
VLRDWLQQDGISLTTADLAPALALLEASGKVVRPDGKSTKSRPGRLATGADIYHEMAPGRPGSNGTAPDKEAASEADQQRIDELAAGVARALTAGNGRGARCDSELELIERLNSDRVGFDITDLPAALARLETDDQWTGCGLPRFVLSRLVRVPPKSAYERPYAAPDSSWGFVLTDVRPY